MKWLVVVAIVAALVIWARHDAQENLCTIGAKRWAEDQQILYGRYPSPVEIEAQRELC